MPRRREDPQAEALDRVREHYQTYATEELERLAKDRYARIEFSVTWKFIQRMLPDPDAGRNEANAPLRVLDAGCGPGRYAISLAQAYGDSVRVSLLDLSPHCLELAGEWARAVEALPSFEDLVTGDVRDLSRWPDAHFDAVLLLGPLYHLLSAKERRRAVAEVHRVLKPGAPVIASAIARFTPARLALKYWPDQITAPELREALETGTAPAVPGAAWTDAAYLRPAEVRRLFERSGFATETVAAAEGFAAFMEDAVNRLSEDDYARWLELIVQTCADPDLLASAAHILYIGRKR
ncbi:MAG TPA: methyltransferase domain-containing protein [Chloroflexota bacterium]|nr:methyltransferase domain-containing protein [Chloroflexota bacterium]